MFFRRIGFSVATTDEFKQELYKIAQRNKVNKSKSSTDKSGINYEIIGKLNAPDGKAYIIITVWFIKANKRKPSFVTAYPV